MKQNKKFFLIVCAAVVLTIIAIVACVIIIRMGDKKPPVFSGQSKAVMTSPVIVINGKSDVTAFDEEFYYPLGVALANDYIIVADSMNDRIQVIPLDSNKDSEIIRIGEHGTSEISYADSGGFADGRLDSARFRKPSSVAVYDGDIIVCDTGNNAIRKISDNIVVTIAGGLDLGYAEGFEKAAKFNSPRSVVIDKDGLIYIADTMNHVIRTIDKDGNTKLFAGTPEKSGYIDGNALEAMFYEPFGLALGQNGELYVADSANHSIRKIENGIVSTVAGNPEYYGEHIISDYPLGDLKDGDVLNARFNFPSDIAVLDDEIYVADSMNHAVRLISGGEVLTILGNGKADKFYGSAENMRLSKPSGIAVYDNLLYVSDTINNAVVAVEITERLKAGRPLREDLLKNTGVSTDTKYDYHGELRLFANGERVRFGKVKPWITPDFIYIPIVPMFEALGGEVILDNKNNTVTVIIDGQETIMGLEQSYFIQKGAIIMPDYEILRLFPYALEYFPEYSVIAVSN